ncbi:MAG: hypothetical protein P4L40_14315 [Terracidiphilus sp.]|nr:hypothetical protein [Terracidiphilus sp.]
MPVSTCVWNALPQEAEEHVCEVCGAKFRRADSLLKHSRYATAYLSRICV